MDINNPEGTKNMWSTGGPLKSGEQHCRKAINNYNMQFLPSIIWGRSSGGVYVPCIYLHARWELPYMTQFFVAVFKCELP